MKRFFAAALFLGMMLLVPGLTKAQEEEECSSRLTLNPWSLVAPEGVWVPPLINKRECHPKNEETNPPIRCNDSWGAAFVGFSSRQEDIGKAQFTSGDKSSAFESYKTAQDRRVDCVAQTTGLAYEWNLWWAGDDAYALFLISGTGGYRLQAYDLAKTVLDDGATGKLRAHAVRLLNLTKSQ